MKQSSKNRSKISEVVGLAPLAGFTESAFRRLARELGADFTWTELTSANFVLAKGEIGLPQFHVFEEERPLRFQLQGSETHLLVRAAERVLNLLKPEGLDLNAGCPARKVIKTGAGAALLTNLPLLAEIARELAAVAHTFGADFSVKFRLGFAEDELEKITETLLRAGVDILVLHPRTAREGFSGKARWERVRDLKNLVAEEARVYGSGDVKSLADIEKFFRETRADGVLIGRAALARPWIFAEWKGGQEIELGPQERLGLLKRLADYLSFYRREEETLKILKLWAGKFLKGLPGKRKLLPEALKARSLSQFWQILHQLVLSADAKYK